MSINICFSKGANGITQATLIYFLTTIGEIFLKNYSKISLNYYFLNSYYFIMVYFRNLAKNVIKKIKHYNL
jgi:hypothetical protein